MNRARPFFLVVSMACVLVAGCEVVSGLNTIMQATTGRWRIDLVEHHDEGRDRLVDRDDDGLDRQPRVPAGGDGELYARGRRHVSFVPRADADVQSRLSRRRRVQGRHHPALPEARVRDRLRQRRGCGGKTIRCPPRREPLHGHVQWRIGACLHEHRHQLRRWPVHRQLHNGLREPDDRQLRQRHVQHRVPERLDATDREEGPDVRVRPRRHVRHASNGSAQSSGGG